MTAQVIQFPKPKAQGTPLCVDLCCYRQASKYIELIEVEHSIDGGFRTGQTILKFFCSEHAPVDAKLI